MSNPARSVILAAAVALVLTTSACAAEPAQPTRSPGELVGVWALATAIDDAPEQPFVSFVQDNSWSASDGCNRVRGTWALAADGTLKVTSGPQTMMACAGAQLPLAVTKASLVEVEGDTLRIHSSYDSTVTELVRSTDPLVGPQGFPIGYWVVTNTPTSPFLSISADRTFTGNDGCNTLAGSWESTDDDATRFVGVASTLMACEGVDTWLGQAALGRVVAGVMTLQAADGTVLGQLTGR